MRLRWWPAVASVTCAVGIIVLARVWVDHAVLHCWYMDMLVILAIIALFMFGIVCGVDAVDPPMPPRHQMEKNESRKHNSRENCHAQQEDTFHG